MSKKPAEPKHQDPAIARGAEATAKLPEAIRKVVAAAQDKKATDITVLDLRQAGAFTDYFVICSGQNPRQVKAIVDAIGDSLRPSNVRPAHTEGYDGALWILLDFFDFVVHVFTAETRAFYALERLWGSAERVDVPEDRP